MSVEIQLEEPQPRRRTSGITQTRNKHEKVNFEFKIRENWILIQSDSMPKKIEKPLADTKGTMGEQQKKIV